MWELGLSSAPTPLRSGTSGLSIAPPEISERAYALWALASALFLGHSIVIGDAAFMVTQLVNIVALAIILVLVRRFRKQICAAHARQLHVEDRP
jgi:hypothetical protein